MSLEKLEEMGNALIALDEEIKNFLDSSPSPEAACSVLVRLNLLKRDMSVIYDSASNAVADIMGNEQEIALQNGATVEKKSAYDRKGWDHKGLASAVASKVVQLAIDMDTGEISKSPQEIAEDMLTYCAPSYWRVKELGKIGINADSYSEVGELRTSIIVRKPKDK